MELTTKEQNMQAEIRVAAMELALKMSGDKTADEVVKDAEVIYKWLIS